MGDLRALTLQELAIAATMPDVDRAALDEELRRRERLLPPEPRRPTAPSSPQSTLGLDRRSLSAGERDDDR